MQFELSTRSVLSLLFRQCYPVLLLFFSVVALAMAYLVTTKPVYESTGTLLVRFGSSAMPNMSQSANRSMIISQNERHEVIQSNAVILRSRELLSMLVDQFGAETIYPDLADAKKSSQPVRDIAINRLIDGDVFLSTSRNNNIIHVGMMNGDPDLTAAMLKRLFTGFVARQSEVYNNPQTGFLTKQREGAKQRLGAAQKALHAFKAKHGISLIEQELTQLMEDKGNVAVVAVQGVDAARSELATLQIEEARLSTTYLPTSPIVQKIKAQLAIAKKQLAAREYALKRHNSRRRKQGEINKRIAKIEAVRGEYDDLKMQVDIHEQSYKNFVLRSEEAALNETLNRQNITRIAVVDHPVTPTRPSRPRKLLIMLMALFAGGLLSIGYAIFRELSDERFITPDQLATKTGLPVFASFQAVKKIMGGTS